jgi:asparagine synthase (glutamine-hydrolysing)
VFGRRSARNLPPAPVLSPVRAELDSNNMPGIVGLVTKMPPESAKRELTRMVEAVRHESFDATGTCADERLGVYVGWAAHRNSFSDGMPLCNERGEVSLFFSGEEYPEPGTAGRLKQRGHNVGAGKPSSYLVHLYEDDPNFPAELNGMFHGLVMDRTLGTATLFNDRYGMHRVYFHESKEAFYFAAEAKAILAVCPELRTADSRGLGEFIACGCVLENRTIFKGIHVLPPASAWVFRDGAIERKGTYFQPREWEDQTPLEPEAYYRELRDAFSRNVPRYFNGHERVGIALTGGLDTRAILAWHKSSPGALPCYTFGGMFHDNQDVQIARRLASQCGQSHQVITVGDEFLSCFSGYAERSVYLTEGTVDVSRASDLYVSGKAREIAPVKVVGTYGSEMLCRLAMFKPAMPTPGLFRPEFLPYLQGASATYAELRREHPVTFAAFRQSPWYHHGILALEQSQLTVRSPYLDNDFVRTVYRAPESDRGANGDLRPRLIGDGDPTLLRVRSDRGIAGNSGRLVSAASRSFLEFTFKAEYAYDYGMPQWVARVDHLLSPFHLERLFLGRHKLTHFRVWYRDSLSEYVREMLLDSRTLARPYLERRGVEGIVRGHLNGNRNYTSEIHKMLTLELLHRQFFDPR